METQLTEPKRDTTILQEYHFYFIFPVQCCALNLIGHVAWPHVNLHSLSHFLPHHKQFPWFCLLKDAFITRYMLIILFPFFLLNSNSYTTPRSDTTTWLYWQEYICMGKGKPWYLIYLSYFTVTLHLRRNTGYTSTWRHTACRSCHSTCRAIACVT